MAKDRSTNREESESVRLGSTLIDAGGAFDFGDRGLPVTSDRFPFDRDLAFVRFVEILKRTDTKILSISVEFDSVAAAEGRNIRTTRNSFLREITDARYEI